MDRYNKYLVVKWEDINKLPDYAKANLESTLKLVDAIRKNEGKRPNNYVVVAENWPMYETVWEMIEAHVDGKPDPLAEVERRTAEACAKVCAEYIDNIHDMRDADESLPMYQPELAGRQAGASRIEHAIRAGKYKEYMS